MRPRDRLRLIALGTSWAMLPGWARAANAPARKAFPAAPRFVVYYGRGPAAGLQRANIVALDADVDAAVLAGLDRKTLTLGYLSVCEVHRDRSWAADVERDGLLLQANANWPDARFVDVRNPRWRQRVIGTLIPALVARGFDGLFLDTLDSAAFMERSRPELAGMKQAAADLVQAIRKAFPGLWIMANRGYDVLPACAGSFDMLMGESVHTTYDAQRKVYVPMDPDGVRWQLDRMAEAARASPALRLFSLDYWNPDDAPGIATLYAKAQAQGLIPYVATIALDRVVARPDSPA